MLALVMTTMMLAENITAEQALQQARSFIQRREAAGTRPRKAPGAAPQQFMPVRQVNGLYLFNVVGGDGFVIVSNDDRATPILGYSDNGTLDPDHMPCNMRAWLQGYADEIAWLKIRSSESNQSFQGSSSRRSHSTADISPLMTTTWDQGEPYNNRCPLYESEKRAVTGCVATAMAQAMYYTETMVGNTTTTTTTKKAAKANSGTKTIKISSKKK